MNRLSTVFLAMLFLLSMQTKNDDSGVNVENAKSSSKDAKAEEDASSGDGVKESNKDDKSNPSTKKNGKKSEEKRDWMVEIEALKKKESEMQEIMEKAMKKASSTEKNDVEEFRKTVREMGSLIIAAQDQLEKARDALKKFNEGDAKAADKSATPEELKEAKDGEEYLKKTEETLKKWKVTFFDHLVSIVKKNTDSDGKPIIFPASDEKSGSWMLYGCIAAVICIVTFVIGYYVGGRKN